MVEPTTAEEENPELLYVQVREEDIPEEAKETTVWTDAESDTVHVNTLEGDTMRRVLRHEEFELVALRRDDAGNIVHVAGELPRDSLGVLGGADE